MASEDLALALPIAQALGAGDFVQAERLIREALERGVTAPRDRARLRLSLVRLLHLRGDATAAQHELTRLDADELGLDLSLRAEVARVRAEQALAARAPLQELVALWAQMGAAAGSAGDLRGEMSALGHTVEVLQSMGRFSEARACIEAFLEDEGERIGERDRLGFGMQAALLALREGTGDAARDRFMGLLGQADQAGHTQVAVTMRLLYGQWLTQADGAAEAIGVLDQARRDTVRLSNPILYVLVAAALAHAYEFNGQRPEAYGTLLRARVSLTDLLGPDGAALPQLMIDQVQARWGPSGFEQAVNDFHTRYRVPR